MEKRDGAVELLLDFGAAGDGERDGAEFFWGGVVVGFLGFRSGRLEEEQGGGTFAVSGSTWASVD